MIDVEEVCPTCGKGYRMKQRVEYRKPTDGEETPRGVQMQFVHGPAEIHEEPIERMPKRMRG